MASAATLLTVTHANPDGDGLGSMVALTVSARAAGKTAHMCLPVDDASPPSLYEFLFDGEPIAAAQRFGALADEADTIVIVDTCSESQLGPLPAEIRRRRDKVVVIDHHATCDDIAPMQWVDASAAASGIMVGEILEELRWPLPPMATEALMTAVVCDTAWMRHANTDSRCLRAVANWLDAGQRPDKLYRRLYQSDRPERLGLLCRTLGSLELHCNGQLAVMTIRAEDFAETGARPDETENMVNEALRIGTVEAVVLVTDNGDCTRASLRSRDRLDVSQIARRFGGGGHARAAGLRVVEDIDVLKGRLISACSKVLQGNQ